MGLFGFGKSDLEKELIDTYTKDFQNKLDNCSYSQARKLAKEMVESARQQSENNGTSHVNYDVYMKAVGSTPLGEKRISAKRDDGVTQEDLEIWWNTPDIVRLVMERDTMSTRMSLFELKYSQGYSDVEAAKAIHKALPLFGDPLDEEHATGDDRPLPPELQYRVIRWRGKKIDVGDLDSIEAGDEYTTYNAFVRDKIREGEI